MGDGGDDAVRRRSAVADYRKKLLHNKELDSRLKTCAYPDLPRSAFSFENCKQTLLTTIIMIMIELNAVRENLRTSKKEFARTEDDLKSLQSVGQIIGEVLRPLDNERLAEYVSEPVIVKASSGPRYVVGCRSKVDKEKLTAGTRVVLDMTTLTIMRALPREVDPVVYNMLHEDPGNVSYSAVGGLSDQIRELRESIELPLMNPELFLRVGIKPPKVSIDILLLESYSMVLLELERRYWQEQLLAILTQIFLRSRKQKKEEKKKREEFCRSSSRLAVPAIIWSSKDTQTTRQSTHFVVKMIMATNRPDVLDPALLRPGRLDRKIEIPLPNEQSRMEILKIHAAGIAKHGDIDYEAVVKLAEASVFFILAKHIGFNGADLRNVCTEAGMSAIRAERDYVIHEDFMKVIYPFIMKTNLDHTGK
ncbi:hypothetical protein BHM03_00034513 [Ensete ventricosum]|nr:hypothetical protein BHM03_00034513 [Ensete ventricosum]